MFKKFNPKEDVASSTSLKSSAQRHIRTGLLEQYPFLAQSISPPAGTSAADGPTESNAPLSEENAPTEEQEEQPSKPSKGGKKKGGGVKKDKGGKGKDKEVETDAKEGGEENLTVLDELWPKKEALGITKCRDHITIYTVNSVPLILQHFEGPFVPTLHVLHKYPSILPHVRIDRGAIKFLLAGANMMAPGLLSAGGDLPDGLPAGAIVAIDAEGKQHAAGIGKLTASSEDIKKSGKGVAVEVICHLGDDLWSVDKL